MILAALVGIIAALVGHVITPALGESLMQTNTIGLFAGRLITMMFRAASVAAGTVIVLCGVLLMRRGASVGTLRTAGVVAIVVVVIGLLGALGIRGLTTHLLFRLYIADDAGRFAIGDILGWIDLGRVVLQNLVIAGAGLVALRASRASRPQEAPASADHSAPASASAPTPPESAPTAPASAPWAASAASAPAPVSAPAPSSAPASRTLGAIMILAALLSVVTRVAATFSNPVLDAFQVNNTMVRYPIEDVIGSLSFGVAAAAGTVIVFCGVFLVRQGNGTVGTAGVLAIGVVAIGAMLLLGARGLGMVAPDLFAGDGMIVVPAGWLADGFDLGRTLLQNLVIGVAGVMAVLAGSRTRRRGQEA